MDCCNVNGLDDMFGRSVAQGELKAYLKRDSASEAAIWQIRSETSASTIPPSSRLEEA